MSGKDFVDFSSFRSSDSDSGRHMSKKHTILNMINSISIYSQLISAHTDNLPDILQAKESMQECNTEILANIHNLTKLINKSEIKDKNEN